MIKIDKIYKKFGNQTALEDISLEIKKGDKVLIMGQNGAGKSTLIKMILGELIPNSGTVLIDDVCVLKERKKALSNISFTPQLPPPLKLNVKELCYYVTSLSDISLQSIISYALKLEFDIKSEFKKPFYKLSGGMKQKLLISLALARHSEILIFDEPTANLDQSARELFLTLLKGEFKHKTLILISHRISEIKGIAQRAVELDLGHIVSNRSL